MSISVRRLADDEIERNIFDLARLRIEVFKEFPYIYDGSHDFEVKYLKKYLHSKQAALIAVYDEKSIVGVSSCLPLLDEENNVQKPFLETGFDIKKIFYFGESVLQKKYRGKGLGKIFFEEREGWAKSFKNQYNMCTFCAVERPVSHPLRPLNYKPLDEFWKRQGYHKNNQLQTYFEWLDLEESSPTPKKMNFWTKPLESPSEKK